MLTLALAATIAAWLIGGTPVTVHRGGCAFGGAVTVDRAVGVLRCHERPARIVDGAALYVGPRGVRVR